MERCGIMPFPRGALLMTLERARELRQELEAIESTMQRIRALAEELPTGDELENLADVVRDISSHMERLRQASRAFALRKRFATLT
jgi:hypothetical protein